LDQINEIRSNIRSYRKVSRYFIINLAATTTNIRTTFIILIQDEHKVLNILLYIGIYNST